METKAREKLTEMIDMIKAANGCEEVEIIYNESMLTPSWLFENWLTLDFGGDDKLFIVPVMESKNAVRKMGVIYD